ncbi:MAG: hypothetical protein ACRDI2_16205 [Chloroflexota bacterium]
MATTPGTRFRSDSGWWLTQGITGGILAGIVFAAFEMGMAALLMGPAAFFAPLRMISAIALGESALDPGYDLATAALTGIVVHLVLSAIFGAIFGLLVAGAPAMVNSSGGLVGAASIYGLLLWLVNFYLIALAAGWTWFPEMTNPIVQFVAHTFFYGSVLGLYLSRAALPRRTTVTL